MATRRAMAAPGSEATSSRETPRAMFSGIPASVTPASKANAETSPPGARYAAIEQGVGNHEGRCACDEP
jgi:hypothetical protein